MNYRHHYHAGNFADVMKHVLVLELLHALQQKEKGLLYLDTHAGRGGYDLSVAATGDTLARKPEWPDGIGRLRQRYDLPPAVAAYRERVRAYDRQEGNGEEAIRYYPGSPWLARLQQRPQDRLMLCEKHPEECMRLRETFAGMRGVSVQELDGYNALQAMLPPPERRALILIDPPFEDADEFAQIGQGLAEGLRRFPSGVFAVWYPLTVRAKVEDFFSAVRSLRPPPALACELTIAGERSELKFKGCGLLILNPPWQFDLAARTVLEFLAVALAQAPGGVGRVDWVVPDA